uniref:F-box domain-containing protein n=1 Tax=Caenorhabditis tropicalis TaxID=1561998 RepID=A0A1I7UWJ1_9PELO
MSSIETLSGLPELPFSHVLKHVDYQSLQALRKVCHHFRNFIDCIVPASRITEIEIEHGTEANIFQFMENGRKTKISYQYHEKGCIVIRKNDGLKYKNNLENEDFFDCFWRDFEIILKHQKSVLNNFHVIIRHHTRNSEKTGVFLEHFQRTLASMTPKLQVKNLELEVLNLNQAQSVLPFVNSERIEKLVIFVYKDHFRIRLDTSEMTKLEIWKNSFSSGIFELGKERSDVIVTEGRINAPEINGKILLAAKNVSFLI